MMSDAKLIISRPRNVDVDLLRSYTLVLDGSRCERIKRGETVAIDVDPGRHTVKARVDWTGSPEREVNVAPGTVTRLWIGPGGIWPSMIWRCFTRTRYLRFTERPAEFIPRSALYRCCSYVLTGLMFAAVIWAVLIRPLDANQWIAPVVAAVLWAVLFGFLSEWRYRRLRHMGW